jgi:hypothetical protein
MAQTMFGKTPEFNQAIEMMRGKDINTKKSIIENVAKEKNISSQELQQWASKFGISL